LRYRAGHGGPGGSRTTGADRSVASLPGVESVPRDEQELGVQGDPAVGEAVCNCPRITNCNIFIAECRLAVCVILMITHLHS